MMYRRSPEELSFSPEHERVLRGLTIDESGPGTVLHDKVLVSHSRDVQGVAMVLRPHP